MSQRFYPRNAQSRRDALSGHREVAVRPRNDRSHRDGLAAGQGNAVAAVALSGTANVCNESDIVAGGKTVIFTITGNDRFKSVATMGAAVIAGLADTGPVTASAVALNPAGAENALLYTSKLAGSLGNDITVRYVDPSDISQTISVSVATHAITVNLATDILGAITSTAAQVKAAIAASSPANALVSITIPLTDGGVGDGSGVVTAMNATTLTGGADGGGIKAALSNANLSLSADMKVLTVALAAVAAYDIGQNASYTWTLPFEAFDNRNAALAVAAAIAATAGA